MSDNDVFLAKLAEQAERFDDMVEHMQKVVEDKNGALEMEERNILSVAFKNVVGARRASLKIIKSIEQQENDKKTERLQLVKAYREKVQKELQDLCLSVISMLDGYLIEQASDSEAKAFYLKMKASKASPSLFVQNHLIAAHPEA